MNTVCILVAVCLPYAIVQGLPFGPSLIDTNNVDIQVVADFAMRELGSEYTILEMSNASRQIVAGYKHIVEDNVRRYVTDGVVVGFKHIFESNIRRDKVDGSKKFYSCFFETVREEWRNKHELTKMCCDLRNTTSPLTLH